MTLASIILPETINLQGDKAIIQGSDNYFEFQIKDADGTIVDISSINPATDLVSEFRTAQLPAGITTNCPIPRLYVSNAAQGKIFLHIPQHQTLFTSTQQLSGWYDIKMVLFTYTYRVFQGQWTIDGLQITNKLNS